MKSTLRSVRIAPKKANLVAKMVRGKSVKDAVNSLELTNKKAARLLEELVKSAMANASHNDKQDADSMMIKTLVVNKAQAYHRGIPMARGRMRRIRKFMSHITVTLGFPEEIEKKAEKVSKVSKETKETTRNAQPVTRNKSKKKTTTKKPSSSSTTSK
ncbi:MAG: 50S ribosomal protein L22 [bacterium]|nr:50S ribosomal protein L22 [bacterium]